MAALTNQEVFDQFLIRQMLVHRYIRKSQDEFVRAIQRADKDLLIVAIDAVDAIGNKSLLTHSGSKALKDLQATLEESRKGALSPLVEDFFADLRELIVTQVDFNVDIAKQTQIGEEVGVTEPEIDGDPFSLYPIDGKSFDEWWALFLAGDTGRIMDQIRTGLFAGEDIFRLSDRIRGTSALGFSDGATRTSINSVKSLVPTLVTGALGLANYIFSQENEEIVQKERYTAILDSRTSTICLSLSGTLFNVGEGAHPPMHRNCRSMRVPVFVGGGDTAREGLTGPEWIKGQSPQMQNKILGKAKADLFRQGKVSVNDLLRQNGEPITLNELQTSLDKK